MDPPEEHFVPSSSSAQAAPARASSPGVFGRDTAEFDRALNFVDAIFGFSITLLITNIDIPPGDAWQSLSALLGGAVGDQLQGFAISFVVIAGFWRLNHRVISRFNALDSAAMAVCILLVGFVIFIPFTTQGISDSRSSNLPLPTALYAVNVTVVVLATAVLVVLGALTRADRQQGYIPVPGDRPTAGRGGGIPVVDTDCVFGERGRSQAVLDLPGRDRSHR